jgi:hypothetical protein
MDGSSFARFRRIFHPVANSHKTPRAAYRARRRLPITRGLYWKRTAATGQVAALPQEQAKDCRPRQVLTWMA